ncbi:hypothetical protein Tco_1358254 [Tanacetum coccineum]
MQGKNTQATQAHEIDWNDLSVLRYHAQLNRPYSVAKDQTQSFMPMDSEKESKEKAEGRMKRKTSKASEDKNKRQKTKDDLEKLTLMEYVQVVSNSEEAINVIPLAVKSLIVSWKSYCKGDMGFYEIHRADGNYKTYNSSYASTRPGFDDLMLWGDMKIMFDPDENVSLDLSSLATTLSRLERSIKSGIYIPEYVNDQKLLMNHYVDMLKKEIHEFVLAKDWKNMDELMNAALEREQETKKRERSPSKRRIEQGGSSSKKFKSNETYPRFGGKGYPRCINCGKFHPVLDRSDSYAYGEREKSSLAICIYARAKRHLVRGCQAYLAHIIDTQKSTPCLDNIPVVRGFLDVFPEELPGLPPERQVEFCIDLIPGSTPIAKTSYRLAPSEMQDLMKQLQELLD